MIQTPVFAGEFGTLGLVAKEKSAGLWKRSRNKKENNEFP